MWEHCIICETFRNTFIIILVLASARGNLEINANCNDKITALHLQSHFHELYGGAGDGLHDAREAADDDHVEVGGRGRRAGLGLTQRLLELDRAAVDAEERAVDDTDGEQREGHALEEAAHLWTVEP